MIALHLSLIALIMIGAGAVAFVAGGIMTMTFDISDWMPTAGVVLAYLGAAAVVIGLGVQVGAWVYALPGSRTLLLDPAHCPVKAG